MDIRVEKYRAVVDQWTAEMAARAGGLERFLSLLKKKGVRHGADKAQIEQLLAHTSPQTRCDVVVARGEEPVDPVDAEIVYKFEMGDVVVADDILAAKKPLVPGKEGMGIDGEVVAVRQAIDAVLETGENVRMTPDGRSAISKTYGIVNHEGGKVSVQSLVRKSPDLMQATMDIYPRSDSGVSLTTGIVREALAAAGVTYGLDEKQILEAISRASEFDDRVPDVVVARGTPPVHGADTAYEFHFKIMGLDPPDALQAAGGAQGIGEPRFTRPLVRKGALLALKKEMVPAQEGRNIHGERKAAEAARRLELEAGPGGALSKDGLCYLADVDPVGYLFYDGERIRVDSPVSASANGMEVRLVVHPPDSQGSFLNERLVDEVLKARGVVSGLLWREIRDLVGEAKNADVWIERVVARGTAPVKGNDAVLDHTFEIEQRVGTERADGSMDFRERAVLKNVRAGQMLVRKTPAGEGTAGEDVYGNQIPAEPGKDVPLEAAEGVALSGDGLVATAQIDGVVMVVGVGKVGVYDIFEVPGDVDYKTGNLRFDDGGVTIQGSIKDTFSVEAKSHVVVGDSVGDSSILTQGDVEVARGIIQRGKGAVRAGGTVKALFAQNARIEAGKDVVIANSAVNCRLTADRKVMVCGGKGRLIGGKVCAKGGVVVTDLGSEMGVETHIVVGSDWEVIEKLNLERAAVQGHIDKIEAAIGQERTLADFCQFPPAKQEVFRQLLAYVEAARKRIDELRNEKLALIEASKDRDLAQVQVTGTVYPGLSVTILEKTYKVIEATRNVMFYYDKEHGEITLRPIR